jgi:hypothetical protein
MKNYIGKICKRIFNINESQSGTKEKQKKMMENVLYHLAFLLPSNVGLGFENDKRSLDRSRIFYDFWCEGCACLIYGDFMGSYWLLINSGFPIYSHFVDLYLSNKLIREVKCTCIFYSTGQK